MEDLKTLLHFQYSLYLHIKTFLVWALEDSQEACGEHDVKWFGIVNQRETSLENLKSGLCGLFFRIRSLDFQGSFSVWVIFWETNTNTSQVLRKTIKRLFFLFPSFYCHGAVPYFSTYYTQTNTFLVNRVK